MNHTAPPPMLDQIVSGKQAWLRADVQRDDWFFSLPAECLAELLALLPSLSGRLNPVEQIDVSRYALPACRALMQRVQAALDDGVRFAVVDRLPLDAISADEAQALYWILSSMLARPVYQKLTGTMVYPVLDTGRKATPGSGVRPDQTNMDQYFHNDNSYNTTPPEYVALLCVRPAKAGGISHVISFYSVNNALVRARRQLIARLYQPFWYDRQKENAPDELEVMRAPMFTYDGRLRVRLGLYQIQGAATMRGEPLDAAAVESMTALREIFKDPALTFDFVMERGQIQFANNRELGHRRTQFDDFTEPHNRRLLLRLWLRNAGSVHYSG